MLTIVILGLIGTGVYFLIGGTVTLETTPADSEILVDGAPQPYNQRRFRLRPGSHQVTVTKEGYVPYNESIAVTLLRTVNRSPVLLEVPSPLQLTSFPATQLHLDDKRNKLVYVSNGGRQLFRIEAKLPVGSAAALSSTPEVKTQIPTSGVFPSAVIPATETVTPPRLSNVTDLIWAPNNELLLIKAGSDTILYDLARYNLTSQTATPLGDGIYGIDWDPESKKIAYFFERGGEKSIIIADPLNKFPTRLRPRVDELKAATLDWSPDGKYLVLVSNGPAEKRNVYLVDLFSQELKQLTTDGSYFDAVFSPDSGHLLISQQKPDPTSREQGILSVIDLDGQNLTPLHIRARLRTQTAFITDSLLVATDQDDSKVTLVSTTLTGQKEPYTLTGRLTNPEFLTLSGDKKTLFYVDQGNLFGLPLVSLKQE